MNKLKKVVLATSSSVGNLFFSATGVLAQLGSIEPPEQGFASSIGSLITSALNLVMLVAALLVFMYLIWGGIEWIMSGGDKGKAESARNKITSAIIGLIVVAASYAILQLALNFLGFSGGLTEVFQSGIRPINE